METCSEGASQNCIKCSEDLSKCEICYQGYYFDANQKQCKQCTEGCNTCSGPTFEDCVYCKIGYFKGDSKCQECTGNCNVCKGPNNEDCLACAPRTYNNTSVKQCLNCPTGCSECHGSGAEDCDVELDNGFYFNKDTMTIKKCNDTLYKCTKCTNSYECLECESGYYYLNSNKKCSTCSSIPGCLRCDSNEEGSNDQTCNEPRKYYCLVNSGNIKVPKFCSDSRCEICHNSEGMCASCSKCVDGYYLNSEGVCTDCPKRDCLNSDPSGTCTQCKSTHSLLDDGYCLYCTNIPHCKKCGVFPLVCSECEDKYKIDSSNGGCVRTSSKEEEEEEERKRREEEERKRKEEEEERKRKEEEERRRREEAGERVRVGMMIVAVVALMF